MMMLVKNDLESPIKKKIRENTEEVKDEEEFNDIRDEDWNKKEIGEAHKNDEKKKYNETLTTVQEEEEPDSSFKETAKNSQNKTNGTAVFDKKIEELEDRDDGDFDNDDDETTIDE